MRYPSSGTTSGTHIINSARREAFKARQFGQYRLLEKLGHYYSHFNDSESLWNLFDEELDRLETDEFKKFMTQEKRNEAKITGDKNIVIQDTKNSNIQISFGSKDDT